MSEEKILICDLDGCLINSAWIWQVVNFFQFPKDIAYDFFNRTANAEANIVDLTLYKYLCFKASGGYKIHFLTARSESIDTETVKFIQKKTGLIYEQDFTISFRSKDDISSAAESKQKRLKQMLDNGKNIILAIDDNQEVIDMYKLNGIRTIKWKIGYIPTSIISEFNGNISFLINKTPIECLN